MADFTGDDLRGSRFEQVDLTSAGFYRVDLKEAEFRSVDLTGSRFVDAFLVGVQMRGVELLDVQIDGEVRNVVVNGVDIVPLVEAELDRRDPDRVKMRPTDPAGFREAWDVVEQRWDSTLARARALDPTLLH